MPRFGFVKFGYPSKAPLVHLTKGTALLGQRA